jgi:5'-3' exonuclease
MKSEEFLEKLTNKIPKAKIIYFSDTSEHDEAEIKIVRYVKKKYNKKNKYIVYSPDADVILLCMSFNKKNINIIRIEYENNNYKYRYVDVDLLMKILYNNIKLCKYFILRIEEKNIINKVVNKYKKYTNDNLLNILEIKIKDIDYINSLPKNIDKIKKKDFNNKHNIINDLILLFIFFGNDFLPKIQSIPLNEVEISLFLFYYTTGIIKLICDGITNYHLSKNMNSKNLLYIMKELIMIELNYINKAIPLSKTKNIIRGFRDKNSFNINNYMIKNIDPLKLKTSIKNDYKYYIKIPEEILYNIKEYNKYTNKLSENYNYPNMEDTCLNYLHGLYWIKESYFNGKIHKWLYKNIFSPTMYDLYNNLLVNEDNFNNYKYDNKILNYKKITPLIQFVLTCPFNFDNTNENEKYIKAFTYDNNKINIINNMADKLNEINNNYYISVTLLCDSLINYRNNFKNINELNINKYQQK